MGVATEIQMIVIILTTYIFFGSIIILTSVTLSSVKISSVVLWSFRMVVVSSLSIQALGLWL